MKMRYTNSIYKIISIEIITQTQFVYCFIVYFTLGLIEFGLNVSSSKCLILFIKCSAFFVLLKKISEFNDKELITLSLETFMKELVDNLKFGLNIF